MSLLLPGDVLADASHPGAGTYLSPTGTIHSSIAGFLPSTRAPSKGKDSTTVVTRPAAPSATVVPFFRSGAPVLPTVDSLCLCRVTRCTTRQATVSILVVGSLPVRDEPAQGIIRRQDVRATEKDSVLIAESFRVGDIVRAVVISLGDQANYNLSTARNDLGVIMAKSEAGNTMYPVSWREFRDPNTQKGEARKVAKPF